MRLNAQLERPDMIICDVEMPVDGYGVLNDPQTAMIPFIFLTLSG